MVTGLEVDNSRHLKELADNTKVIADELSNLNINLVNIFKELKYMNMEKY